MSKLWAILWKEWRQTRWIVILFPIVGFVIDQNMSLLLNGAQAGAKRDIAEAADVLVMILMGAFLIALLLADRAPNDVRLGFQRRLYRLPVSTRSLVVTVILSRLMLAAATGGIILGIHHWYFGETTGLPPYAPMLACFVVALAWLQAVSWFLGAYGCRVAIAIVVVGACWMFAIFLPWDWVRSCSGLACMAGLIRWIWAVGGVPGLWALAPASIALACGVAFIGVRLDRRGTSQEAQAGGIAALKFMSWGLPRERRFASAAVAQLWFEWRRRGGLFVGVLGFSFVVLSAVFGVGFLMDATRYAGYSPLQDFFLLVPMSFPMSLVTVPCAAFATGLLLVAMDHRDRISGAANFVAVRPISTRVLASARLHAGMRMVWIAAGFVSICLIPCMVCPVTRNAVFDALSHGWGLVADSMVGVVVHGALIGVLWAIATWTLLWSGSRLVGGLAGLFVLFWITSAPETWLDRSDSPWLSLACGLIFALAVLTGTAWSYYRARRIGLIRHVGLMWVWIVASTLASYWFVFGSSALCGLVFALAAVSGTAWLYHRARRTGLIRYLGLMWVWIVASTLALYWFVYKPWALGRLVYLVFVDVDVHILDDLSRGAAFILFWAGLLVLPIVPFAAVPLGLHRRRSGGGRVPMRASGETK